MNDSRIAYTILCLFVSLGFFFQTAKVYSESDNCGCENTEVNKMDRSNPFMGGVFSNCDGRIVGPDEVCHGVTYQYELVGEKKLFTCDTSWTAERTDGTLGENQTVDTCTLTKTFNDFSASIYIENYTNKPLDTEPCTGAFVLSVTTENCNGLSDCGEATMEVTVQGESDFNSGPNPSLNRLLRIRDLMNQLPFDNVSSRIRNGLQDLQNQPNEEGSGSNEQLSEETINMIEAVEAIERGDLIAQSEQNRRENALNLMPELAGVIADSIEAQLELLSGDADDGALELAQTATDLLVIMNGISDSLSPCSQNTALLDLLSKIR